MIRPVFGKALGVTALTLAFGSLAAVPAMADSIPAPSNNIGTLVSVINVGNTALAAEASGPYASIYVNFTSNTTALISVIADPGFHIGGNDTFGFNTDYTGTVGSITWSGGASDTSITCATGTCPGNVGTFGAFDFDLSSFDGATRAVNELQFTFTLTSGSFAGKLPSSFLSFNGGTYDAAAHIFPIDSSLATGFAGENSLGTCPPGACGQNQVPEPASLLLLGTGLGVVAQRVRRKIRRA